MTLDLSVRRARLDEAHVMTLEREDVAGCCGDDRRFRNAAGSLSHVAARNFGSP